MYLQALALDLGSNSKNRTLATLFSERQLLLRPNMLITFKGNGFGHLLSSSIFTSQFLYSTTSSPHFLVKYLVDSLGFSNKEAASTSSKVTSSKTLNNPDLVISYLKQIGLDNTQMKKLVYREPRLLLSDVSKTLKPKIQCLMDLGLSGSDLVNVIVKDPQIVQRGIDTRLKPTVDFLRRILGSDDNVVKAIKRTPWLLSFGTHHFMETNLLLLKDFGVTDVRIKKLVLRYPRCIAENPERIKGFLHRVEKDFRVPRDSPIFLYGFLVLQRQTESTLDRKIGIFKRFGWSENDVLKMFQKQPYCVALSEVRIQKALHLFMKEFGFETAYLVSHPAIFLYSIEKRVVPRVQVLKILDEKKVKRRKLGLYSALTLTETKFIDHFVLPYKVRKPGLYEQLKKIVAP